LKSLSSGLSVKCLAMAAVVLAAATAGCSGGHERASRSVDPATTAYNTSAPLPSSTVHKLPHGAFYILWGVVGAADNLWEVTPSGQERQLTHNPRGYEVDSFAASKAGIILSDAIYGADLIGRWTGHGVVWMPPWHAKGKSVRGFAPDIRSNGQITYLTPSNAIWLRQSFSGAARVIYRYPSTFNPGSPVFGPAGQIAILPSSSLAEGQKASMLVISAKGTVHTLATGIATYGYPAVWGQNAPALAVPRAQGREELFFSDGKREELPTGWKALSWSPDGSRLLVISDTSLGLWSTARPSDVSVIGRVNRASEVVQVGWLSSVVSK
jgi:hypothetical protein